MSLTEKADKGSSIKGAEGGFVCLLPMRLVGAGASSGVVCALGDDPCINVRRWREGDFTRDRDTSVPYKRSSCHLWRSDKNGVSVQIMDSTSWGYILSVSNGRVSLVDDGFNSLGDAISAAGRLHSELGASDVCEHDNTGESAIVSGDCAEHYVKKRGRRRGPVRKPKPIMFCSWAEGATCKETGDSSNA